MRKIIWTEGALLTQQHMQFITRQLETSWRKIYLGRQQYAWGIQSYDVGDFLKNGYLALKRVVAIFQSGQYVEMNYSEGNEIKITVQKPSIIYLSIIKDNTYAGISGYPDSKNPGWEVNYLLEKDELDCSRESELAVATPILKLLDERDESYFQIPIVKINNSRHGFIVDNLFVPPMLSLEHDFFYKYLDQMEVYLNRVSAFENENILFYLRVSELRLELLTIAREAHPIELFKLVKKIYLVLSFLYKRPYRDDLDFDQEDVSGCFKGLEDKISFLIQESRPKAKEGNISILNKHLVKIIVTTRFPGILAVKSSQSNEHLKDIILNQCKLLPFSKADQVLLSSAPGIKIHEENNFRAYGGLPKDSYLFSWGEGEALWDEAFGDGACVLFIPFDVGKFEIKYIEEGE